MRKIPSSLAAVAVLALAAVSLVGCSVGTTSCDRASVSNESAMKLITVSGELGSEPDVEIATPFSTTKGGYQDVITGSGTPITSASQDAVFDVDIFDGKTGSSIIKTAYDGDMSRVFSLSALAETFPHIAKDLKCATEGSRVAVALAPSDISAQAAESFGLDENESAVAVIDLHKVFLARATGSLQFNTGNGLPSVVRAPDGRPGVTFPNETTPPSKLVVQTLIKGDGPVVKGDVPIRVNYTGLTWKDQSVFQTTWDSAPASLDLSSMIPGVKKALEGQTVGSQVMIVIPPAEGYGDKAQGSIPADSTLVFVFDILGLDVASPTQ